MQRVLNQRYFYALINFMLMRNLLDYSPLTIGNYTVFTQQLLGKGATGCVYKGQHNFTKLPVAVKAIDLSKINDEATKSLLQNQKAALRCLSAPSLLKLEDIIQEKGFCYIVTELCEGITLSQYLKKQVLLNQREAMAIFRKIVAGCLVISQQCIIHRDLKPANIMIGSKGDPKIIDFGYCEIIRAKKVMKTFNVGSPSYMSPEAYLRTLYSQKSDSWSLGMILFEMLHGETLDHGMDIPQYFQQMKGPQLLQKKMSKNISAEVRQIIQKAFKYLPDERSSISTLKYQADLYNIKRGQKQISSANSSKQIIHHPRHLSRQGIQQQHQQSAKRVQEMHSMRVIEGKSIMDQNKQQQKGFISFSNFAKIPLPKPMLKMKQMTSLQDFDDHSLRNSLGRSQKIAVDHKLQKFLQTVVKKPQPTHTRPASSYNIVPTDRPYPQKQITQTQHMLPPPPPRQVTVRFM